MPSACSFEFIQIFEYEEPGNPAFLISLFTLQPPKLNFFFPKKMPRNKDETVGKDAYIVISHGFYGLSRFYGPSSA